MKDTLTANAIITIHAPVNRVWQALTDPALIKQYLFGTDTISDWKKGSSITWSGVYEGKSYRDKGTIVDIVPEISLHVVSYGFYFTVLRGVFVMDDKLK